MNRMQFGAALSARLAGLSHEDMARWLDYYDEMIEDRMEEGLTEEEAVAALGSVEEVAAQILSETPLLTLVRARVRPRRPLRGWEILLLILGAPLWISLLAAAFSVLAAVFAVLFAVIASVWAVDLSFACCAVAGVLSPIVAAMQGNPKAGVFLLGAGVLLAGLAVFGFYGCIWLTKLLWRACKTVLLGIKRFFVKGEASV